MALSFKDSFKSASSSQNVAMTNAINIDDSIATFDLEDNNRAVYDGDVTVYAEDGYTVSDKYSQYPEYSDDDISVIDRQKNITVNQNQINLTQEANSQFIPFRIGRYYDGVDLMNMTLSIHYVTAKNYENTSAPINVSYNDEYIKFGWLVDLKANSHAGTLAFEIQAIGKNSKDEDYIFKTKPNYQLSVLASLSGDGVAESDKTWLNTFLEEVSEKVTAAETAASEAQQTLSNCYTKSEIDDLIGNLENAKY